MKLRQTACILLGAALLSCGTDESTNMVFDPTPEETGDGTSADETPVIESSFSFIQEAIFTPSCATSGCHVSTYPNLTAGQAHAAIVNGASSAGSAQPLVKPGDPDNSYLLLKMTGAPGISGNRMPLGRSPLSEAYINSVRQWIERGAPND